MASSFAPLATTPVLNLMQRRSSGCVASFTEVAEFQEQFALPFRLILPQRSHLSSQAAPVYLLPDYQ